jgi:hypothetical protein
MEKDTKSVELTEHKPEVEQPDKRKKAATKPADGCCEPVCGPSTCG